MRRTVRAIAVTSFVWATAWILVVYPLVVYSWATLPEYSTLSAPRHLLALYLFWLVVWGAASGAIFALLIAARARRQGWHSLRLGRVATWGALAAFVPPVVLRTIWLLQKAPIIDAFWLIFAGLSAAVGAALAAAHVALARRSQSAWSATEPLNSRDDR